MRYTLFAAATFCVVTRHDTMQEIMNDAQPGDWCSDSDPEAHYAYTSFAAAESGLRGLVGTPWLTQAEAMSAAHAELVRIKGLS